MISHFKDHSDVWSTFDCSADFWSLGVTMFYLILPHLFTLRRRELENIRASGRIVGLTSMYEILGLLNRSGMKMDMVAKGCADWIANTVIQVRHFFERLTSY